MKVATEPQNNDASDSFDEKAILETYAARHSQFAGLLSEAVHTLKSALDQSKIKYHDVDGRIKDPASLIAKCTRQKCYEPFGKIHDLVGVRVICLFKDDLDKIGQIIGQSFKVRAIEDKRSLEGAPIGYMSVHYVCEIPDGYSGPRYDGIKNQTFEIQVRTLCMHSWAAVSHYLDYKGDWDVPRDLKMALSALSGLFYVADNEFQQFYQAREAAMERAKLEIESGTPIEQELNLDTVRAFLRTEFPNREGCEAEMVSDFVQELKAAGYLSLAEVVRDVRAHRKSVEEDEKKAARDNPYLDIGVARLALCEASTTYKSVLSEFSKTYHERWAARKSPSKGSNKT